MLTARHNKNGLYTLYCIIHCSNRYLSSCSPSFKSARDHIIILNIIIISLQCQVWWGWFRNSINEHFAIATISGI